MLALLDLLKTATTVLSGETFVSVSLVYPIPISLLNRHLNSAGDPSKVVVRVRVGLQEDSGSIAGAKNESKKPRESWLCGTACLCPRSPP